MRKGICVGRGRSRRGGRVFFVCKCFVLRRGEVREGVEMERDGRVGVFVLSERGEEEGQKFFSMLRGD